LTAGKKLCGKTIAQSDDTYLTTVNLRQKFVQLKKFLTIMEQPKAEAEKAESLKSAINKLQEELTQQRTITEAISEENINIKKQIDKLQPLTEFVNTFDTPANLKTILDFLTEDYSDEKLHPLKVEFSPNVSAMLQEIARTKGITQAEALKQLVGENLEALEKADEKLKKQRRTPHRV